MLLEILELSSDNVANFVLSFLLSKLQFPILTLVCALSSICHMYLKEVSGNFGF